MTAAEALSSYLNSLNPKDRRIMSRKIRRECDITRTILYNWRHGLTDIKTIYRDKINEIVGFNLFENVTKYEIWH